MDFSTLIIIVIVLGVLGAIGSVLFWVGVAYFGVKAVQGYQQQLDAMKSNYSASISSMQNTYGHNIPPEAQQQILAQYMQAQNQLNQFDRLSQDRQDLFRSDMLSQASSAGIDVSSW